MYHRAAVFAARTFVSQHYSFQNHQIRSRILEMEGKPANVVLTGGNTLSMKDGLCGIQMKVKETGTLLRTQIK